MRDVSFRIITIGTLSMNRFWGEGERIRQGTATCTLITVGDVRLLVDPSPHPEPLREMLFARSGLRPEAIDAVYVTHFHGDHLYGLELFPQATYLMAEEALTEWRTARPDDAALSERFAAAEGRLPDGVALYAAPGHTLGLHALTFTDDWGRVIVCGDAVMTREFLRAEEGYHNSIDFALASETIRRIKRDADVIIPGHDNLLLNR